MLTSNSRWLLGSGKKVPLKVLGTHYTLTYYLHNIERHVLLVQLGNYVSLHSLSANPIAISPGMTCQLSHHTQNLTMHRFRSHTLHWLVQSTLQLQLIHAVYGG